MYPSISEYIESIRFAEDNFDRLKHLAPVLKPNGEPFFSQGNFAVVFKMTDGNGKFYALKCFTRELPGRDERYALICDELHYLQSGYFIEMKYFCNELFVSSDISDEELFPVLLMDWVEGVPLDLYLRNCIDRGATDALAQLSYRFGRFASWLIAQPFAHGDLKPDNLLVRSDGSLVAVDYDGMFVPAMAERGVSSSEMGSPDYRHPKRTSALFGPAMDHFPLAVMALSLEAIATEPTLLQRYACADGLLFCERDFFSLSESEAMMSILALLPKSRNLPMLYSLFHLAYKKMTLPVELSDCFRLPEPATAPQPSSSRTFTVKGVSFLMKLVKAGTFMMGATPEMEDDALDNEFPVHKVTLTKDYYMGETQVTQALWQAVMGKNPSWFPGNDQRPVECVSWNDCQDFIEQLNRITGEHFRLPTEAEWEFAARGGNESKGCRYAGSNDLDEVAWYDEDWDKGSTHPVAGKQPNELGLYDMSGNVYEWCADWYEEDYYQTSPEVDPQGPASVPFRVLRGGSWDGDAWICRLSHRDWNDPVNGGYGCGLRLSL